MHSFAQDSGQVEKVAVFLTEGTQNQTRDIEKSLRLLEEFTDKIGNIFSQSQELIALAYDMEKNNQGVRDFVGDLVENQVKNDEAIDSIFVVVKNLIERTRKIGEVTNLINKISSETNLLGLNAKVEAVHAGAAGRGFSVVADEIQRLSQESKTASVDISDMIKGVTDEITRLEKVATRSKDVFNTQRDTVTGVNGAVEKNSAFINTYISEQNQFNRSIEMIKRDEDVLVNSISNIFGSVREIAATANEITSLTYDYNNTISLLSKLEDDLNESVDAIDDNSDKISVVKKYAPKKRIMMVFDFLCEFWEPTQKEAEAAMATYNYDVEFYAPEHRGMEGSREMVEILDKAIEEDYDALVISPHDDTTVYQRIKDISNKGTQILFLNSKLDNIDYVSFIQTNGVAAGEAAARVAIGALGGQGEVIVNAWSDLRIKAIEDRRSGFVQEINAVQILWFMKCL